MPDAVDAFEQHLFDLRDRLNALAENTESTGSSLEAVAELYEQHEKHVQDQLNRLVLDL